MEEARGTGKGLTAATLRYIAVFLGMMLYWPLLRRTAMFYSVGGHDQGPWQAFTWYSLFLVLAVLVAAVAWLLDRRGLLERVSPPLLVGLFVVQAVAKVAETSFELPAAWGTAVALVDVVTYAVVFVTLTLLWVRGCIALDSRAMALLATASFAVSFVVVDAVYLLGCPLRNVVLSVTPGISALCWWAARRWGAAPLGENPGPHLVENPAEKPPVPLALLVVVGVFMVAGGVVRGLIFTTLTGGPFQSKPLQNVGTVLFAALIFLYCALGGARRRPFQLLWSLAAVLFFAGLLLMTGMGGSQFSTGGFIVVMGRTCLGLIYWIMLCDVARTRPDVPGALFAGVFVFVEVLSSFLGYIAIPVLMESLGLSSQQWSGPLVGAVAFILIIAAILFFNRPQAQGPVAEAAPLGKGPALPAADLAAEAHRELFAACRLTDREAEVAELLAAGNSQKRIAEKLQVSIGTVQSHVKNIYRKLDVHSRQEFLDELHGGK